MSAIPHPDFQFFGPDESLTAEDLLNRRSAGYADLEGTGPIRIRDVSPADLIRAIVDFEGRAREVYLLPPETHTDPPTATMTRLADDRQTRWILYTSGTTGTPKAVAHTLDSLTRTTIVSDRMRSLTWGLLYAPSRMAGIQVLLQALVGGGRLVAPANNWSLADKIAWMRSRGVTALSATPTVWRQILQSQFSDGWELLQVTLGGEIADQKTLDALNRAFPNARISHVFASTEAGAAFSVSDRRAGFPADYLTNPPRGVGLRVVDGELEVFAPGADGPASSEGWVRTGDNVSIENGRVLFLGRQSGFVNVGGAKVWPEEVEQILRQHPQVVDALVTARANPFSGFILVASVVVHEGAKDSATRGTLRDWVRSNAPTHFVPATIKLVDRLEMSETGKAIRR